MQLCERKIVEKHLRKGDSKSEIARILGVSHTTIGREVNNEKNWEWWRKSNGKVVKIYNAEKAQKNYEQNKARCGAKYKFIKNEAGFAYVENWVLAGESPDQAIERAKLEKVDIDFSSRTFYNYIERGMSRVTPFNLRFKLRRKPRKHKRIRQHKRKMGKSIELRPSIVNNRTEFGHWEGDFIVDKNDNAILVLQERMSRKCILRKVTKREKNEVFETVSKLKTEYNMKSLTIDNDSAFFKLPQLEDENCEIYFTHPYSSFEKGGVENLNGIVRRYVPKGTDLSSLTGQTIERIQNQVNDMPRKIHGYYTSDEMYVALTNNEQPRILKSHTNNLVFLKQKVCI